MGKTKHTLAFLGCLALLTATAVVIQIERDRRYATSQSAGRLLYLSSGTLIEKVALSYDALLADVYWIRAIQHYGGDRLRPELPKRYEILFPLLDLMTSLDPHFKVAYRFGAFFLSEEYPGGPGRPDQAVALLEKGIRATPDTWEYYHDIGFVYYWRLHDYQRAAEWFLRGADRPGGPWWLRAYAAVMLTKGGDRGASRGMWRNLYETTDNPWLRSNAEKRLMQLDALDQIDQLHAVVGEYQRRTGRHPRSWDDLVSAGFLRGMPHDPSGTPYLLNSQTGVVSVSGSSPLYPLPVEPDARPAAPAGPARPTA